MRFNINETVRVRLTPLGEKIHREHWERLGIPGTPPPSRTGPDGWSSFQLWDLMSLYGEHIHMACDLPFETEIEIPAPASPAPSEEAPALDPDKCDEEVFRDGEDVGVYGSLSRPEAQRLCADLRALTGWRWDWNYAAGRVVLRVLRGPGAPSSEAGTRG